MSAPELEKQLLDAVADAVVATDLQARIIYWNWSAELLYGWKSEEVVGRFILDVIPPQDRAGDARVILDTVERGNTWTGEFLARHRNGSTFTVHMSNSPLKGEQGDIVGVIGVARDVTAQRELDRAQRESERVNRAMLAALPDLVFRLSESGQYLDVRAHDTKALAAPVEELLGSNIADALPPEVTTVYMRAITRALRTGQVQTCEYPLVVQHGGEREFEARIARCAEGEVISIVRDVTERVRAEQALRESADRLQLAMEAACMGTWELNTETGTVAWSHGMHDLVGVPPAEFDGRFETFLSFVHPEDRHTLSGVDPSEVNFNREFRIIRSDGSVRWIQTRGHTYRDVRSRAVRMVGVSIDVTERKLHEQALVEAKEAAEEMARLKDSFLANMSHEIRTPLTSIIGFADVLMEETTAELQEMARLVRGAGERLLITLESVLDLAKLESGAVVLRPGEMDLVEQAQSLMPMFRPEADARGLYLQLDASEPTIRVRMDAGAFGRVMNNIIANALKFTKEGGISVRLQQEDGRVRIEVSDTGIGIDDRFQSRVFEEFSQESEGLARSYEGAGLGLAITQRLVDLMGGTIEVSSRKGQGTTFTLTFPR